MHLKRITIFNIRGFGYLRWSQHDENLKGWHVIIGDNGAGKSTFLKTVSLALCGPEEIPGLRLDWKSWLRRGAKRGSVSLVASQHKDWDNWQGKGRRLKNFYPSCSLYMSRAGRADGDVVITAPDREEHNPERNIWSQKPGWFSASYGPFRRFTGGDPKQKVLFYSHPVLARYLSIFDESVALTESLEWLRKLRFEELEGKQASKTLLAGIWALINQGDFLPHGVKLEEITSDEVQFRNADGGVLDIAKLSDGYRSVLSLTFELIRQMASCYKTGDILKEEKGVVVITPPGVVLIDEIDVHLHPTWQRQIGFWLTKHFPNVQFIVTTHSPLVCQAAENGSVFRLPAPGSEQEKAGFVKGTALTRLINGDVLDAYGTELFGDSVNRSKTAQESLEELAMLNQKKIHGSLSRAEKARRLTLLKAFPVNDKAS